MGSVSQPDERSIAEAIALPRSPLDPLRGVAAADAAGLRLTSPEAQVLAALLDRLGDAEGEASAPLVLRGDPEPRSRLLALLLADALVRGARRFLWVGPRPRAIDRLAERCALRLHEVRPARGAYAGEGLLWVPSLEDAPPGLGQAAAFERVIAPLGAPEDPPWNGHATLLHGAPEEPLPHGPIGWVAQAPRDEGEEPRYLPVPHTPGAGEDPAEVARTVLSEGLHALTPAPLDELALRAAAGSNAALGATLRRLETRLGRMARAARAGRADDGLETARQLVDDRGETLAPEAEGALKERPEGEGAPTAEELEAERAQLADLRGTVEAAGDPALDLLAETARSALKDGGVCVVVASNAARTALSPRLRDVLVETDDPSDARHLDARLDAARREPAIVLLAAREYRDARLDRVALTGLTVIRLAGDAHCEADIVVGAEPRQRAVERIAEPRLPAQAHDTALEGDTTLEAAAEAWRSWRSVLGLKAPVGHPSALEPIERALALPPRAHAVYRLEGDGGCQLLLVGDEPLAGLAPRPTLAEAHFEASLALLPLANRRLDRRLQAAREARTRALARLEARRRAARAQLEDCRKRHAKAMGPEARAAGATAVTEAEAALRALDAERGAIDASHTEARRAALARFAAAPRLVLRAEPSLRPASSQVSGTVSS